MRKRNRCNLFLAVVMAFTAMGCSSTATITETGEPVAKAVRIDSQDLIARKEQVNRKEDKSQHGMGHKILFYIPNRVLDAVDMVRLRARVGPGMAAGVRVTTLADIYVGSYVSAFAGLPGPRMRPIPKLPLGLETYNGVKVSLADATLDGFLGPGYSPTEAGFSIHLTLIGLDVGIDPVEIIDFVGGFLSLNIRDDEL